MKNEPAGPCIPSSCLLHPECMAALAARLSEAAGLVAGAAERLSKFQEALGKNGAAQPPMRAADIQRYAAEFQQFGASLGRLMAEMRNLRSRLTAGGGKPLALAEMIAGFPGAYRAKAAEAHATLRSRIDAFRRSLSSLGYVAGTHLVYLDALLRFIGEAAGLEATYHPRRCALPSARMGLVDRQA